jgi:hypothetical protein
MKARRQLEEMKKIIRTIDTMGRQTTTDRLSAHMGAAAKEVELARHLSFYQKATLNRLIEAVYTEAREETVDTDVVIDRAPAGLLGILFT